MPVADEAFRWDSMPATARRVALEVLLHGPLARTELAARLGLSTPSLSRITKPLLDAGILRDAPDPEAQRSGGRPLQPLQLNAGFQSFIGIKLAAEKAFGVRTDLHANVTARHTIDLPDTEPANLTKHLAGLVEHLEEEPGSASAVGVALGGAVSAFTRVERAYFLGWHEVDLGSLLGTQLGQPVIVSNDIAALTEAEHWFGDGRDVNNFAVLTIGAGVGGGLVVHDQLVEGPDAGQGLLGHFLIDPTGPYCPDGHRGCADSFLSIDAIRSQAGGALGEEVTYDDVLDLAEKGEQRARRIVDTASHALGLLIAAVANIAQPERIILTGEGIRLATVGQQHLNTSLALARIPEATPLDIRIINDDPYLWARGAAAVAIQQTLLPGTASGSV
jgi:predicted NBD/HSP70 family sugar kinase